MSKEMRIFGPPGVGKTTTLATKIIPMLAEKYGPEKVMLTSFTKAAARELGQRIDASGSANIGTLHSMCYKALKHPPLTEEHLSDWNTANPKYSFISGMKVGPALYSEYQIYRNKMINKSKWNKAVLKFAKAWESWKNKNHLLDFIDLIELAGNQLTPPGSPAAIVIDESQDFTRLEMSILRSWATQCQEFWVTGDPNQCSTAGTVVETTKGPKLIEKLNPSKDYLKVYSKNHSMLMGSQQKGFSFDIATRQYSGIKYTFHTDRFVTNCTDGHFWNVKWNNKKRDTKWKVVYLMKKDNWFRIGFCQLFVDLSSSTKDHNRFHLKIRMRQEKADSCWILKIFDNSKDASIYESYISAKYGITQCLFIGQKHTNSRILYTNTNIAWMFNKLGDQTKRAISLLSDHKLNIKWPVHSILRDNPHKITRLIFKIRALNIAKLSNVSNFLMIPTMQKKSRYIKWEQLSVTEKSVIDMPVYSLNVEKYHTYVADGICSCNCIYNFSGASAKNMLEPEVPEDQKIYLKQSYRVPKAVHKIAMKVIERVSLRDKTPYSPRDFEGSVTNGIGAFNSPDWVIREALKRPGTSMIAASCNYMLNDIIQELRNRGIPFSNPWRKEAKEWNPLDTIGANVLLSFISTGEDGDYWDTNQFLSWASHVVVGNNGLIRKQGKEGIKQLQKLIDENPDTAGLHTCREYIDDILSSGVSEIALQRDVSWLQNNIIKKAKRMIQFPARVLSKQGKPALTKAPKIYLGTYHSFKGTESDNVFLYPDLSFASMKEMETQEGYDNLCRLFYVGITRAKENLILMPPATSNYFEI